jgi:hypothetical protein
MFSPAWHAFMLTLDVGFICCFVVIDPTDQGATTVVVPGPMVDNFLPTTDVESLPLYSMVLKLACVQYAPPSSMAHYPSAGDPLVCFLSHVPDWNVLTLQELPVRAVPDILCLM